MVVNMKTLLLCLGVCHAAVAFIPSAQRYVKYDPVIFEPIGATEPKIEFESSVEFEPRVETELGAETDPMAETVKTKVETLLNAKYTQKNSAATAEDKAIDVLTTGQIVLNGFQNLIANAPVPSELSKHVEGLVNDLKHIGIHNKNELSNLGFEYMKALKERGFVLAEKNQKLLMSAFSLIGHIFLSEEYQPPTRRNAFGRRALTLNIINDKKHIDQVVQAIKKGLASVKNVPGKNVNQNLNLNINIYTLLNVGKKLKQEKII